MLGYDDIPQLQEVVRAIRRAGGKINSQCGIHIHIDAAPFDGRHLGNLAKIIYKQEPLILHALGISRDRLNCYTRPVSDKLIQRIEQHRPRTKDQLNRIWYGYHNRQPQHYDNSRYHGVNLHNVCYRGTDDPPAAEDRHTALRLADRRLGSEPWGTGDLHRPAARPAAHLPVGRLPARLAQHVPAGDGACSQGINRLCCIDIHHVCASERRTYHQRQSGRFLEKSSLFSTKRLILAIHQCSL